jgi:hypothetical protein
MPYVRIQVEIPNGIKIKHTRNLTLRDFRHRIQHTIKTKVHKTAAEIKNIRQEAPDPVISLIFIP